MFVCALKPQTWLQGAMGVATARNVLNLSRQAANERRDPRFRMGGASGRFLHDLEALGFQLQDDGHGQM